MKVLMLYLQVKTQGNWNEKKRKGGRRCEATECYGLNCVSSTNSCIEVLTPVSWNRARFGGQIFKEAVRSYSVKVQVGWPLLGSISVVSLKEGIWTQTCMCTEKGPCEDTGRRWPSTSQGVRPQLKNNPADALISDSWAPEL